MVRVMEHLQAEIRSFRVAAYCTAVPAAGGLLCPVCSLNCHMTQTSASRDGSQPVALCLPVQVRPCVALLQGVGSLV